MLSIYSDLGFVVEEINSVYGDHCDVLFGSDATKLQKYDQFEDVDCVIFNLPQAEEQSHDLDGNRRLVEAFLTSCSALFAQSPLEQPQTLYLSLHCNVFNRGQERFHRWKKRNALLQNERMRDRTEIRNQFETWNVDQTAKSLQLDLQKVYRFEPHKFNGYRVLNHLSGT